MSIDQILSRIKAALDAFAVGLKGTVSVSRDPYNVFEILAASPAGYVLILSWAGDQNINDITVMPLLRHRVEIVLGSNLGLTAKPDLALIQTVGNRPPIYLSVDELRSTLLGLRFPAESTGGQLEYIGAEPVVTPDGVPLAAFKLAFALRAVPSSPNTQVPI